MNHRFCFNKEILVSQIMLQALRIFITVFLFSLFHFMIFTRATFLNLMFKRISQLSVQSTEKNILQNIIKSIFSQLRI